MKVFYPSWMKTPSRGKSGLHRAVQGVTPLAGNRRNSGTERMSRAMILDSGTGESTNASISMAASAEVETGAEEPLE